MEESKPKYTYSKKLKDFADYKSRIGSQAGSKGMEDFSISAPSGTITPLSTIESLVEKSVMGDKDIKLGPGTNYGEKETLVSAYPATAMKEVMQRMVAEEAARKGVDPYSIVPGEGGNIVTEDPLGLFKGKTGPGGYFYPPTGNITMNPKISPENYASTLIHELGHKKEWQSIGPEKSKTWTPEQRELLMGERDPNRLMPMGEDLPITEVVNREYKKHQRADSPEAFEIGALRNLKTKGTLAEPNTRATKATYDQLLKRMNSKGKK